jgi:hypothetical protein
MPSTRGQGVLGGATLAAVAAAALALCVDPHDVSAETPATISADRWLDAEGVNVSGDTVWGNVANRSSHEVRDVKLRIVRAWLWRDEKNPGPINPGGSYDFTVAGPIAPGASVPFRFTLPSVDAPADLGSFQVSAEIVGYTEIEYPGR